MLSNNSFYGKAPLSNTNKNYKINVRSDSNNVKKVQVTKSHSNELLNQKII